ncbi:MULTISPECIES: 16S rRNA (guanine(527)-N(7))-methyltransferase RsmG [unclassified Pedobacter]|uniref:16S rRNA (guanine(527)-N(7))-methyltransferase RsmG n=1 Tax=Pedobacter TaxID=84567 RepID=UPI0022485C5A|nr:MULTISPECIES: 16S rRNA (guanine(527)-N(7))-methyltransferase RsmG [unclassified Pedobacter]MCX2429330.1 16S rRNA (guanine(527)-N(7))-methyltransferase RsmG [Pedobacter sp. GR22-10]MCX2583764.1 16S rRNA (guanine(527)-N(7))-methyltransferase RsmG [Pedobacter sp. MR22-3]
MADVKPDLVLKYFPDLTAKQIDQFSQLFDLYVYWNAQINVISRKDIEALYERHVLHSLGIAKVCTFRAGESVLDVGTGGGFPGIPLAILFPDTQFYLVDSIGKKIKVVKEVASALGLENLRADHLRAEQIKEKFNFVVSRAVTRLGEFYPWIQGKFKKDAVNAIPNGILYLKGGDLDEEIKESKLKAELYPLSAYFEEDFFETKYVVYVPQ